MMAGAYLSVFFGQIASGYIATFYETMSPALFWAFNAGVCFVGTAAFYVFGPMLTRVLTAEKHQAAPIPNASLPIA